MPSKEITNKIIRFVNLINELQSIKTYNQCHFVKCKELCVRGKHFSEQSASLEKEFNVDGTVVTKEMWKTHTDAVQKWCNDCESHIKLMLASESVVDEKPLVEGPKIVDENPLAKVDVDEPRLKVVGEEPRPEPPLA